MAKKEKKEKALEQTLYDACSKLRSQMSGINYMYFVMGLVFIKFADLKFEKRRQELLDSEDAPFVDRASFYTEKNVFYLSENSRWSKIKDNAKKSNIGIIIDDALEDLEKNNKSLKGALPIGTYTKTTLPPEKFASLINEIDKLHEDNEHPMDDLIGKTYQYFINKFAVDYAKEKGEFYTPDNIVDLITTLIEPFDGSVYDPCCGTGGMFIQSLKFVDKHHGNDKNISIYGQESNPDTWKLAKMNLAIRGIPCDLGKDNRDTFLNDIHKDKRFDYIIANPPFNLKNWRTEESLTDDARWKGYGLPPVSNGNYAWILHMLARLSDDGVAGFLLANGALNDSDTKKIRMNLIKKHNIEAIIVLPREMFYHTDISVTLWIIRKNKEAKKFEKNGIKYSFRDRSNEVLFIDTRKMGAYNSDGFIELSENEFNKIKDTYYSWLSDEKNIKMNQNIVEA